MANTTTYRTSTYKTFAAALSAAPAPSPRVAANDNKPKRKQPEPRYRGTLPALRWLYDNHPELAPALADAVQELTESNWNADAIDNDQEIRPTIGELMRASTDEDTGEHLQAIAKRDSDNIPYIQLGALKFRGNLLVEYGRTKKGRKLQPRDRVTTRANETSPERNPSGYIGLRSTTPSPMHAESYQRPFSGEAALVPMYDPQKGVEANRAVLRSFGVDGSVSFCDLPAFGGGNSATKCPTAIAKGAEFLGGIVHPNATASSGALMWEAPKVRKGEARRVIDEVAARGTLQSVGAIVGGDAADGKAALIDVARILVAANDNKKRRRKAA